MSQRLRRSLIVLGVVSAIGVGSAIAVAANNGSHAASGSRAPTGGTPPFAGISAVASAPSGDAVLDPTSASMVRGLNARFGSSGMPGVRLTKEARAMPGTVDGKRVYLIPTDKGALCTVVEGDSEMCGSPLSAANPAFVTVETDAAGGRPTVFGIAMDGVNAISLTVDGAQVSVPVKRNLFVLHGSAAMTLKSVSKASARFSDGSTVPIR